MINLNLNEYFDCFQWFWVMEENIFRNQDAFSQVLIINLKLKLMT